MNVYANAVVERPPSPNPTERQIPPPPGLPINDHLIPILIISLLFGSYMMYRYNQKQKNPE